MALLQCPPPFTTPLPPLSRLHAYAPAERMTDSASKLASRASSRARLSQIKSMQYACIILCDICSVQCRNCMYNIRQRA